MRFFGLGALLLTLMGLQLGSAVAKERAFLNADEFVRTENGRFKLGQEDFYFVGTNFYRLALADRFPGSDYKKTDSSGRTIYPLVDEVFDGYVNAGIRVVRLWGFSCEGSKGSSASPALISSRDLYNNPFTFHPEALEKLDYVVASAAKRGVKLILPLVNFEHEYCGMEWWVENILGESDKHLFYTSEKVWERFTAYTKALLEHKNPYTGRSYKDEPGIMAIELANEPHTKDYYEPQGKTGRIVYDWLVRFSRYVKSIDSKHLISHGEEGYLARLEGLSSECQAKHQWIHNGSKGTDYALNATIPTIDFLTSHVYPDNWNIPISDLPWVKRCIFEQRAGIARSVKKPIILEETGFNERPDAYGQKEYKLDRPYFLSRMFRMATEAGFSGTMVWQAVPLLQNGNPADDDDFTFPFVVKKNGQMEQTPEGAAMAFQVSCMKDFAPSQRFDQCVSICPKGTSVNDRQYGLDPEGHRCYLPPAGVGIPVTPFPQCDNGSAVPGGWGWTQNQALCLAHPESAAQYPSSGGCSCKG